MKQPRSLYVWAIFAACLGVMAPYVRAQDGLEGAVPRANLGSPLNLAAPFTQTLAVADFDNDQKLDGAVLVGSGGSGDPNRYHIELHLSGSNNNDLTFQSTESALAITASDVNHDGKPDVVIERPVSHKRLYVWLNDGQGRFHKGRVEDFPSADLPDGKHAEAPGRSEHCPGLCLSQQRGSETMMLAAGSLRARPPSTNELARSSLDVRLVSAISSANSSRAPPFYPSL